MKFKQIGVAAAILGLTSIGVVATAGSASAHTPSIKASCDGIVVSGTGYETGHHNQLKIVLDGKSTIKDFDNTASIKVLVPQDGKPHDWAGYVYSDDKQYQSDDGGVVGPCGKPDKPEVTKEKRDKKDDADCTKDTVTTEHQERTHDWTYNQDKNKWEPKDSEWVTTSRTEHEASDEDCADHVDKPEVTTTETKTEGAPDCTSKTVTITTVTTTHDWTFNEDTDKWVAKDSSKTTKTTRPATELECPPPVKPAPVVTTTTNVGKPDCDKHTVTTTTTTTTTDWVFTDGAWVKGEPKAVTTSTSRETTEKECPAVVTPPVEKPPVVTPPVVTPPVVTPPAAAPVVPAAKVVAVPGSGAPHTGDSLPQTGSADATLLLAGLLAMSMGFFGIAASRLMRRKA